MKSIAFFNNKGGVGKTTTVYHLAWMLSEMGHQVLAIDLDPQSNLSSMFLSEDRMEEVVLDETYSYTVLDAILPLSEGEGYQPVHIEQISERISLLIGDLALSAFEDKLSDAWNKCLAGDVFGFKVSSVFKTLIDDAVARSGASWVLIDVGPNLGAINRAVLIATQFIAMPVASDLFSLQGIKNLGQTLQEWREQWKKRVNEYPPRSNKSNIPDGEMSPIGYILMQYTARQSRPVKSYIRWAEKIPGVYQEFVLNEEPSPNTSIKDDPHCLAQLKHYHSLAPMSMEAHKPMFLLKPADGAIGAHVQAVMRSYDDFLNLTEHIIAVCM
ncbi:ParA family protein [Haliscomenobacter hydrossis]|uniref:Phage-related regulatory protein CII n=1 Tax=Haliscomenobacter hydrossis (strain ATCC 27775 / DSM 1100 / LMG 10767 / O) TaxID=760192 RepID=F4KTR8_HALH1|nr:AAA family ATPase [Haliscomenobacter hydrossis]AEE48062.1 phage-related regulatory protein CII [Haliscomenobacter hydrossis DSM 1100]